jgi:hypothetical protein
VLAGSHTWPNFQDCGESDPPPVFDYDAYLTYLQSWGHNFFRFWVWEETYQDAGYPDLRIKQNMYPRTGPGNALDGKLKFDLSQFDQTYFDRMRLRIMQAGARGMYVSVMLFNGFSVGQKGAGDTGNPWIGHPYNSTNNINSINGDTNGDGNVYSANGYEVQQGTITAIQNLEIAYVHKVIDTVGDLDNVMYEICNEIMGNAASIAWEYSIITEIRNYEAEKAKQHPIVLTVAYPGGSNSDLFASSAEAISPNPGSGNYQEDPDANDGSKVIILDTDHLWGIGGDRVWAWKAFTRGHNPIFMDPWDTGGSLDTTPDYVSLRSNLGYILNWAKAADLIHMLPQNGGTSPCNTGHCLYGNHQYICYQPSGTNLTLDLSSETGTFTVKLIDPATGTISTTTTTGGATRTIARPSSTNDWACWLYK